MLRQIIFCIVLTLSICLSTTSTHAGPGNDGFERGINLSHWYAQIYSRMERTQHLRTFNTEEDIKLIKSIGFDHVRFTVNPDVLTAEGYDGWSMYRQTADMILANGLNVIVDVHPEQDFKEALADDPEARKAFVEFWQKLAHLFADTDPAHVRFELLNEPVLTTEQWEPLQTELHDAVRAVAPKHTIILTGGRWSGVTQLTELTPIFDNNVVYNFHFYDPHQFTHQAATWGAPHWRYMQGLPYPVNEAGIKAALAKTNDPAAVNDITHYGNSGWGPDKVREEISKAATWAKQHGGLTLSCNEFGVYMKSAPPEDRKAWLRDVRQTLEANHIGWTMWDYKGGFAVVSDDKPIDYVVEALGLKTRAEQR